MTEIDKQKFRNDQEFYDVVRTFHEIVTEINKSFKKAKKHHQKKVHLHNQDQIKKSKTIRKDPICVEFKRNQFHMRIAYKIFYSKSTQNATLQNIDIFNPLQAQKQLKIIKNTNDLSLTSKAVTIIEGQEKKEQI